jgi:hypothetical protein
MWELSLGAQPECKLVAAMPSGIASPLSMVASSERTATVWTFALGQSRPNPARGSLLIDFEIPAPGPAALRIYDVMGRRVRSLVDGPVSAGRYSISWDRRTDGGSMAAPGI